MKHKILLFALLLASLPMFGAVVSASRLYAGWNAVAPVAEISNLEDLQSLEQSGLLRVYQCDQTQCYVPVSIASLELGKGYWVFLDSKALTPPATFLELVMKQTSATPVEPEAGWNFHGIDSTASLAWMRPDLVLWSWNLAKFNRTTVKDVLDDIDNFNPSAAYFFQLP